MKFITFFLTVSLTTLPILLISQDCNSLPPSKSDFCWTKKFLVNSPIHDDFDDSYIKYNQGKDEYYPQGADIPWGGNYMPLEDGGITQRGKTGSYPKTNNLLTWDEVKRMKISDIAKLSPSEKMDIYLGNQDFRITKKELISRGPERANVEYWEGFCNGVRAAGALTTEPIREIQVKSKDPNNEIFVIFSPNDLKALAGASYYWTEWYASLGENNQRKPDAGIFDILLREILGKQHRTFFVDVELGIGKFNESVVGYKREITRIQPVENNSADYPVGTVKVANVRLTLHLLGELPISNESTIEGIGDRSLTNPRLSFYNLFINSQDEIIGGEWTKIEQPPYHIYLEYPDYVWFASGIGVNHYNMYSNQGGNPNLKFEDIIYLIMLSSKE